MLRVGSWLAEFFCSKTTAEKGLDYALPADVEAGGALEAPQMKEKCE